MNNRWKHKEGSLRILDKIKLAAVKYCSSHYIQKSSATCPGDLYILCVMEMRFGLILSHHDQFVSLGAQHLMPPFCSAIYFNTMQLINQQCIKM